MRQVFTPPGTMSCLKSFCFTTHESNMIYFKAKSVKSILQMSTTIWSQRCCIISATLSKSKRSINSSKIFNGFRFKHFSFCLILPIVFFGIASLSVISVIGQNGNESEIQTITKCLADLDSSSVDIRKRAVMILGKYSNPAAKKAIVKSLRDVDAGIRRSALVSITESRPLPLNSRNVILAMIGDKDVHIRRIASSYIPDIIGVRGAFIRINGQLCSNQFSPALKSIIQKAFKDEDATVRKNMITNYQHFRGFIDNSALINLIRDSDRDVRALALNASSASLGKVEFIKQSQFFAQDEDKSLRLQYVKILGRFSNKQAVDILEEMASDRDFEISTEAMIILFRRNSFSYYPELRKRLDDNRISQAAGAKIIRKLSYMNEDGESALIDLFNHKNVGFRELAIQAYGNYYWKTANLGLLIGLLDDPLQQIRNRVTTVLLRSGKLDTRQLQALALSQYNDIREFIIKYSRKLDREAAQRVLLDLIIDDVSSIRIAAIKEIVSRKLSAWKDILEQTLSDDADEIRRDVIHMIQISNNAEAIAFARGILKKSEKSGTL